MDLEQCYKELEGDYAEVMRRLRKEELVHRFLIKFLESDEVQRINEALQERDYEKAFVQSVEMYIMHLLSRKKERM